MADWRDLLGPDSALGDVLPGFRPRREQRAMAEAVATALGERSTLVVEAGTGTGKTFAYLLPALYAGTRVIVSTGTRNLQDQLFHRDLPLVTRVVGRPVQIALLKGRSNYLCRHRLALEAAAPTFAGLPRERRRLLGRIALWAESTSSGDIAEVESVADNDPIWPTVTSTRENCLGQDCPEFRQCHVVRARREAQGADLVVVNHHLLLADMALREEGFGELLPGAEAVILDEAHQFPEVAAQFFGSRFGSRGVTAFVRDTRLELERAGLFDTGARQLLETLEMHASGLVRVLAGLGERVEWTSLPDAALETAEDLCATLEAAVRRFEAAENEVAALRHAGRRASEMVARLRAILTADEAAGLRWATCSPRGVTLEFTPFEVADKLKAHVAQRPCAWIHTSATLAVGEDFGHYTRRIGAADARTVLIPSPFDFESQALLYLPPQLPDPSDRSHTAAVVDAALPLLKAAGGRAFLLFTSHRALTEAAARLRERMDVGDRFPLLIQGDMPRDALVRRFREIGHAVLLGTSSFWEGVDVRGPALSVVVIDKLPFAAPDDPMLRARLEGLRREGRNGFAEVQIPTAVLALKQGVGRLIRDPEDFGVVMIADPRLRTKGYGRIFLSSLPPMRPTVDVGEATAFLRQHLGALAAWEDT